MHAAEEQSGELTGGTDQKQRSRSSPPLFLFIFTSPHHEELRNVNFKLTGEALSEKEVTDGGEDILNCLCLLMPR